MENNKERFSFTYGYGEDIKFFEGTWEEGMKWVKENVEGGQTFGFSPIVAETGKPTRLKDIIIKDGK